MERPVIRAGIAPAEDPSLFTAHCYRSPSKDAEELLNEADDLGRIIAGLDRLDGCGATALRMRFGFDPYASMSAAEVGAALDVTGARVRQIEKEAIRRLVAEMDGAIRWASPAAPRRDDGVSQSRLLDSISVTNRRARRTGR
jgi:hypothetical protein